MSSAHADTESRAAIGTVTGSPKIILQLEAAGVLVAAVIAYAWNGRGWLMFALLFLAPDISMLGYLGGRKLGAGIYNFAHTYILPAALAAYGLYQSQPLALDLALIWIAHIGFDRLLGFGLKYQTAFRHTHLSA
ncbi:MAG TPA: DUF4260 domain-containing protein [Xanthobacteraceae bacterium]|jgi:hypothetical protein|nr:DUF4260 domain-containing protein [Xanthobacteraceae bacterium]